eukprot:CAMPEP_0170249462 /NCGR_PEP_ID=MMETSP0116_2-20130129/24536_1 /TAXON_ID=400756 /ORGANISM="Durinskia baltica, Strain CSIRO CS-38" /LENGTH=207 /DNA_ID=CAMNT_0010500375 /DNA_START=245 /DNA_END=865 /DNA_ORIENTATION=+
MATRPAFWKGRASEGGTVLLCASLRTASCAATHMSAPQRLIESCAGGVCVQSRRRVRATSAHRLAAPRPEAARLAVPADDTDARGVVDTSLRQPRTHHPAMGRNVCGVVAMEAPGLLHMVALAVNGANAAEIHVQGQDGTVAIAPRLLRVVRHVHALAEHAVGGAPEAAALDGRRGRRGGAVVHRRASHLSLRARARCSSWATRRQS